MQVGGLALALHKGFLMILKDSFFVVWVLQELLLKFS